MHQIVPVYKKSLCHSLEFTKPPIIILSHKAELMLSVHRFLLPCCHVLPFQSPSLSPLSFSLSLSFSQTHNKIVSTYTPIILRKQKREIS